jgi:putative mRNA 3-end processing factor
MLVVTSAGLFCPGGDFHVDPWKPVDRAIITHAHGDHVAWGCKAYLTSAAGCALLADRLPPDSSVTPLEYGSAVSLNGVIVSLHPAGHILGSSQVRIEKDGQVWVVSGDYKTAPDATCAGFELVRCHTFVTESTFALPIYRWERQEELFAAINTWWQSNQSAGKASVIFSYALGKAQRVLSGLDPALGPIYTHGAVERMTRFYRMAGVSLPPAIPVGTAPPETDWSRAIIVGPPSASGSGWMRRFAPYSTGFASGWMRVRGARRRRAVDRGFALSDHADWPGLLATIEGTGAEQVWVTHGFSGVMARWLEEKGLAVRTVATYWEGEQDDAPAEETT